MLELFNMGGYAVYVWSSYSVTILLAFFLYKRSISQLKFAEKKAKDQNLIPVTLKEKVFKEQSI